MVKILVVEDDKSLNALVCSYLNDSGYAYKACFNGAEALEALENETFDLIISDVMMPELDGFGLGQSDRLLAEAAGTGSWRDGKRFSSSASQTDVNSWVQGLGLDS